jgi:hypothetical protein
MDDDTGEMNVKLETTKVAIHFRCRGHWQFRISPFTLSGCLGD